MQTNPEELVWVGPFRKNLNSNNQQDSAMQEEIQKSVGFGAKETIDRAELVTGDRLGAVFNNPSGEGLYAVQGTGIVLVAEKPEWYDSIVPNTEDEVTTGRPATLTDLFGKYRSIENKIAEVQLELLPIQAKLGPLALALQDQKELIDAKLKEQGIEKGKAEGYAYAYSSSTRTVITDESLLPPECWTEKPDAKKIKAFLLTLPKGADLAEYGAQLVKDKNLSIKPLKDDEDEAE